MSAFFYVSRQGNQEGPHSLELIEDKMRSGYLVPHDYIYDAEANQWVGLAQFKLTKELCARLHQTEEVTESLVEEVAPENTWYLLKGDSQSGPYSLQEVVEMLQAKKAFEYDYVWSPKMSSWTRVSECEQFSEGNIKPFLNSKSSGGQSHFRRKTARVEHGVSLVLHNNKALWNGKGFEVSASGASIEVQGKAFTKGDLLLIHYRPSKNVPAFNVHCEVVSCKKNKGADKSEVYRLGLRFIKVNTGAQKILHEIVTQNVA